MNQIDRIKSLVGQAVGEASMCWKPDGVFNDGQAVKIVEKVVLEIVDELDLARTIGEAAKRYCEQTGTSEATFLAGAEWMRKQFTLHGTTDCYDCQNGRATLYATHEGRCVGCAHKRDAAIKKEGETE